MMQITNQEIHHLCQGLWKWPIIELRFFLTHLMDTFMVDYEKRCVFSQITIYYRTLMIAPGTTIFPEKHEWLLIVLLLP
jgi:hypothetical protein